MSDRALFLPIDRGLAREDAWSFALDDLITDWTEGEWSPCRDCELTVDGDQLLDIDPCDDCVATRIDELDDQAAEARIERLIEERAYEDSYR
jgi:hypothetical protein